MDEKELKKLTILLEHWIEHNQDHAVEFEEWAEKAKELSDGSVFSSIMAAAKHMMEASESLKGAVSALRKLTP